MKPWNLDSMLTLAKTLSTSTLYSFKYGIAYEINEYTADGTIFDYMSGVRKVLFYVS